VRYISLQRYKIKIIKKPQNSELRFFLNFFLADGRIWIHSNSYGSGSGQRFKPLLTNIDSSTVEEYLYRLLQHIRT
jgi:hypothetical protein